MSKKLKKYCFKVLELLLKYFIPVVLAWIEGDTHALQQAFSDMLIHLPAIF